MSEEPKNELSIMAPSNIAFVKYWGKKGRQYPINPSVSMTLRNCLTMTNISYKACNDGPILKDYVFEEHDNLEFTERVQSYLSSIVDICPALNGLELSIQSGNTFPHSAGIASSASSFATLGYALAYIEDPHNNLLARRASELARLGSGSSARSIEGPYNVWGECDYEGSSNDYAVPLTDVHEDFDEVNNTILLISSEKKEISSSQGHILMNDHPFKSSRIEQAIKNTKEIIAAMQSGDWPKFGKILEEEALTLHSMMMTSNPSFLLLEANSIEAINRVREYRKQTNAQLYFTIDAGPNIHLIYPEQQKKVIKEFIDEQLASLCVHENYIDDTSGGGVSISNG